MSSRQHEADRGLGGVARVRGVREQSSRVELQAALDTHAAELAAVEVARTRMRLHPAFTQGPVRDFQAHRATATAMARAHEEQSRRARTALVVVEEARLRWQGDRTRLRAVEMLLDRRAAARRAERARRETAELDDIGAQAWLRREVRDRSTTSGEERR
jgi:flagellar export protein FliJ